MVVGLDSISNDTAVSVGFVIFIVGLCIKIAVTLTEIKSSLKNLEKTPRQLGALSRRVQAIEYDLNNLWAAVRTGDPNKLFEVMRVIPRIQQNEVEDEDDAA